VDHLREASVLAGRFRLIEPVGAGGPGRVWRAADLASGHEVAVTELDAYPAGDTLSQARFRLVARTVVQLSDPGIAQVHEFGEAPLADDLVVPYLVRELVSGQTLDERLSRGPLPAGEALRVVASVAGTLAVAHRSGVAHGHIVPANIVLGPDAVKVTDFAVRALRRRPAADAPGALSYAAPELASGGPATPEADMYALGVVFIACLAGITSGEIASGGDAAAGRPAGGAAGALAQDSVPGGLASLWAACLGPSPRDRPSAAHAAVMSRQVLSGTRPAGGWSAGSARVPAAPDELGRPPRAAGHAVGPPRGARGVPRPPRSRRRRLVTLGAAATGATAAAAVVAALLVSSLRARPASPAASATSARASVTAAAAPGPSATGRGPTPEATSSVPEATSSVPEATSPVLASTPAPLSPLAAIGQISRTVRDDVAVGQMRPDVGVDFDNLIQPVQAELAAGKQAPVAQLVVTLRAKLWTRVSEGAVNVNAASVLNGELSALLRSASNQG